MIDLHKQENVNVIAWRAITTSQSPYTPNRPVESPYAIVDAGDWPTCSAVAAAADVIDLAVARHALEESSERIAYTDVRREIGLD